MDASKVVFGELGTLLRRGAVERETPLEGRVLEAARQAHEGRLCEKLLLQDQLGRDTDHHTALEDHFALAPGGSVWQ
jgi:hypothetical protein